MLSILSFEHSFLRFIMSVIDLLLLIFSFHSFVNAISTRATSNFVFDGDAPYTVSDAALAAALTCPNGNPTAGSPPVLLVHGTGSTGPETWEDGYVPVSSEATSIASRIYPEPRPLDAIGLLLARGHTLNASKTCQTRF